MRKGDAHRWNRAKPGHISKGAVFQPLLDDAVQLCVLLDGDGELREGELLVSVEVCLVESIRRIDAGGADVGEEYLKLAGAQNTIPVGVGVPQKVEQLSRPRRRRQLDSCDI